MGELSKSELHLSRYADMKADRIEAESWWQEIAELVLPRKSYITDEGGPDDDRFRRLYDTTAIDACNTLANGHSSYITPGDQRWFYWSAPDEVRTDEAEAWYRRCSEIAALYLAASNFYTILDESYLDRSGFGLAAFSCWLGKRDTLNFRVHGVNSYCLDESDEQIVDVIYFEDEKGIRQIRQMFGKDMERSPKLAKAWTEFQDKGKNTKHKILHCVYPRSDMERDRKSWQGKDMPIASVYLCCEGKTILHESGFAEMPYTVTRYLRHNGRGDQYGFSPSWRALPAIRQVNFLQKALDMQAERLAVPPVLIPASLEGDVDLRAGGQTIFEDSKIKGAWGLPQEWAMSGNYPVGKDRVESKQDEINRAYHVDLFKMFAMLTESGSSPPTATQIAEMSGEKMVQFSPSFSRFVSDFQTCMRRIFWVLLRAGKFPQPPPSAVQVNRYTGNLSIENPKVVYQSKIALALQQLQNSGMDRLLQRAMIAVEAGRPDVLDNIDLDRAMRLYARNDGVPEEVLMSEEQMEQIREARQQQMEQERQLAMAAEGAKAAGSVGLKVA